MLRPRSGPIALLGLPALAVGGLVAAPAAPAASTLKPVTGGTTLELTGPAWSSLRAQGARLVALEGAELDGNRLTLPATSGRIGPRSGSRVRHEGIVQIVVRRDGRVRRLALTGLETRAGKHAHLSARIGDRRYRLLSTVGARPRYDGRRLQVTGRMAVTRGVAGMLRRELRLARAPRGVLARAATRVVRASPLASGAAPAPSAPTGSGGSAPPAAGPAATPPAESPRGVERFVWRPRESFIRYIDGGEGTQTSDGASDGPREVRSGSAKALVYSFGFTPRGRGPARELLFGGTLRFGYRERGIDLSLSDPEVDVRGATGSLTAVYGGQSAGDAQGRRIRMLTLDVNAGRRSTANGTTTYEDVPATITDDGARAFGGFYNAGDAWGTVTVSEPAS